MPAAWARERLIAAAGTAISLGLAAGWPHTTWILFPSGIVLGSSLSLLGIAIWLERVARKAASRGYEGGCRFVRPLTQEIEKYRLEAASAQTKADEMQERYHLLTENLAASVIVRDAAGRILYASPYTEVLTGYALAEIYAPADDFFLSMVHEQDRERYLQSYRIMATGEPFQTRYRVLHKSGIDLWYETRTVPLVGDDGDVISYLSVTIDVTQAVRYQRQVEEKNRDLQDFTYIVSHDLKAPIFTIRGMANMLVEDYSQSMPPEGREALSHITKAASNLEALIASVLKYSQISAAETKLEPLDMDKVVSNVLGDLAAQITDARGEIERGPLPLVLGDDTKLYQVFSNLVGNALKFRSPERPPRISIREVEGGPREAVIEIKDNGIGIPEDKLGSIFRPFQRAHGPSIEGWGVGLASVRRLLDKLGGTISVKSSVGNGSSFLVALKRPHEAA